jgi:hypothetical protein
VKGLLATLLLLALVPLLAWAGRAGTQPPAPPPAMIDAELGVPLAASLLSIHTSEALALDGVVEAAWEQAPLLHVPLHRGLHGVEPAGSMELRSLHDDERVYLLARWPSLTPGGEPGVWRNLLTVHWRLHDSGQVSGEPTGSEGLACTVACHTATADGEGRLVGIRNETIPPGLDDDLASGGGWSEGEWILEWARQRVSGSPYDQDVTDPAQGYRFFVKILEGHEDRADPVSDVHELRLGK